MILAILFGLSAVITLLSLYFSFTEGYFHYSDYSKKHEKDEKKVKQILEKYEHIARQ